MKLICRNHTQQLWCKNNKTLCSITDTLLLSYIILLVLSTIGGITWGIISATGTHTIDPSPSRIKIPETIATFLPAAAIFQLITYRLAIHYFCEEYALKNYSIRLYLTNNISWQWPYYLLALGSLATIMWGAICLGTIENNCVLRAPTTAPTTAPVGAPTTAPVGAPTTAPVPSRPRFMNETANQLFNIAMVGYGIFGVLFLFLNFMAFRYFGYGITFNKYVRSFLLLIVLISSIILGIAYTLEYPPSQFNTNTAKLLLLISIISFSIAGLILIMGTYSIPLKHLKKVVNRYIVGFIIMLLVVGGTCLGLAYTA